MEIRNELMGFVTLSEAKRFNEEYAEILDMIPVGKWVRCKEIDKNHYARVGKLFKALCDKGLANKREVDDGIIEIPVKELTRVDNNGQYETITAYDKNSKLIGEVSNPRFNLYNSRYKTVIKTKAIHSTHIEYMYLGA